MSGPLLSLNDRRVVHETIDGETIVIHMGTGTYYSFDGAGTDVWALLEAAASREAIVGAMQERYSQDAELVSGSVERFLEELVAEDLILEGDKSAAGWVELTTALTPFAGPVLHKYTDMQEFMMVDPLHDVEAAGWPSVKAG